MSSQEGSESIATNIEEAEGELTAKTQQLEALTNEVDVSSLSPEKVSRIEQLGRHARDVLIRALGSGTVGAVGMAVMEKGDFSFAAAGEAGIFIGAIGVVELLLEKLYTAYKNREQAI